MSNYLGITIDHNLNTGITKLSQTGYLKNILQKFGMNDCKPVATPMEPNFKIDNKHKEICNKELERKGRALIGCLMYAMIGSRPDLCLPVSFLSKYQSNASEELWTTLKKVLRYFKGNSD